jgi:hypothetical protein
MTKEQQKKLFIGAAVLGGGYLAYEFFLKDLFKKKQTTDTITTTTPQPTTPQPSITAGPVTTEVITTVQPSPIGTPDPQLKWNTLYLEQGMRGQEVKRAQELLNAISNIYGTNTIATDGVYGPITRSKMTAIVGTGPKTLKQVYNKYLAVRNS